MTIDGKEIAAQILARTKERVQKLSHVPVVVAYIAEEPTPATRSYLNIKKRSAEAAGCSFEETRDMPLPLDADAVIVQLPLPSGSDTQSILDSIPLNKDADILSITAREKFERGDADALTPPVVAAIREILMAGNVEVKGKKAVVIGSGWLVGKPAATWLGRQGADVEVVTSETADLATSLRSADIIISGAGSPHLIKPEMLSQGVVLIDAGTSESSGVLAGDADPSCAEKCSLFTPVPGGVGPIAVACLFENAVLLAERTMNA